MTSKAGPGTTSEVTLPPVASTDLAGESPDASDTNGKQRLAGLRILFAEDNEINQMVLQAMLRPEGAVITTVGDGLLAVEQVQQRGGDAFDVVLMDIQMPGMDGYEATRLIREMAPDLPIIGQTAHALQDAIEQCHAAGMVAHLAKPIDRHVLIAAILRYARPRALRPQTTAPGAGASG